MMIKARVWTLSTEHSNISALMTDWLVVVTAGLSWAAVPGHGWQCRGGGGLPPGGEQHPQSAGPGHHQVGLRVHQLGDSGWLEVSPAGFWLVDSFTTCCREGSSVVVDVHQAGRGVARQSSDRVSRGHSESERQRSAEVQLHNCDRIETVGEERARHLSESAAGPSHWTAGRRKRAATLGCEVSKPAKLLLLTRLSIFIGLSSSW